MIAGRGPGRLSGAHHCGRGLYLHVPFCSHRCRYCDFCSTVAGEVLRREYLEALRQEWVLRGESADGEPFSSIYVGGGTPSLLSCACWEYLLEFLLSLAVTPDCEWTIEANPESLTREKLRLWRRAGVNRLSIGVQSLDERVLKFLGRRHTPHQALLAVEGGAAEGFASVGVDLMYGIPWQSGSAVVRTVEGVLATGALAHVSAYELTLSPSTPLGRHRSFLPLPSQESVVGQYECIRSRLTDAGFYQYEVSNYSLPGFACRHNTSCWHHDPYMGLGMGAHSWLPPRRQANTTDWDGYLGSLRRGELPVVFRETVTGERLECEMLMLALRTTGMVEVARIEQATGRAFWGAGRRRLFASLVHEGILAGDECAFGSTAAGVLLADGVAGRFFESALQEHFGT